MTDTGRPSEVASPCVQICVLDEGLGHCTGCGRTRAEIWKWTRCSDAEKLEILKNASARMAGSKP
jgi:predicted Fe-S protein YdhL (DUF1289 family)